MKTEKEKKLIEEINKGHRPIYENEKEKKIEAHTQVSMKAYDIGVIAGKSEAIKQLKQIIKESSYVLLFVYIAITSINLSNLNEVFVRAFNWTILIGTSLFIIILTTLDLLDGELATK